MPLCSVLSALFSCSCTVLPNQVLLAHLASIFQPELLSTLPAAAAGSNGGRRTPQQQLKRLPGLAPTAGPLPASGTKQDWQAFIATLPDTDAPELFGLPANIERAMAMANSRRLLAALRQMGTAQVSTSRKGPQVCSWHRLQQRCAAMQPIQGLSLFFLAGYCCSWQTSLEPCQAVVYWQCDLLLHRM